MTAALGMIIAERVLVVVGSKAQVTVRLGRPRRDRASGDYSCPFIIDGLGDGRVQQVWGVDAVQALQLAMQAIRMVLLPHARKLKWLGGQEGSVGFPMALPEIFGAKFSQRLERMVQRETDRFGRSLERAARKAERSKSSLRKKQAR